MTSKILFLTSGSYSDYCCMGVYIGEPDNLKLIRTRMEWDGEFVTAAMNRWSDSTYDTPDDMKNYAAWAQFTDLMTIDYFKEIAARHHCKFIPLKENTNTVHLDLW